MGRGTRACAERASVVNGKRFERPLFTCAQPTIISVIRCHRDLSSADLDFLDVDAIVRAPHVEYCLSSSTQLVTLGVVLGRYAASADIPPRSGLSQFRQDLAHVFLPRAQRILRFPSQVDARREILSGTEFSGSDRRLPADHVAFYLPACAASPPALVPSHPRAYDS